MRECQQVTPLRRIPKVTQRSTPSKLNEAIIYLSMAPYHVSGQHTFLFTIVLFIFLVNFYKGSSIAFNYWESSPFYDDRNVLW